MTPTSIGGEKQAGISGGGNSPADIASGRIAEVRSRSMSCNCMTRTSQQECRGILEYNSTLCKKGAWKNFRFFTRPFSYPSFSLWCRVQKPPTMIHTDCLSFLCIFLMHFSYAFFYIFFLCSVCRSMWALWDIGASKYSLYIWMTSGFSWENLRFALRSR